MSISNAAYSHREYAEMHFIYGVCNGNARAAAREYQVRYPNRERFPNSRVFQNVHRMYSEGEIPGHPRRAGRSRRFDIDEDNIIEMVTDDPSTSVRRLSRSSGVSRSTVHRILKRKQLHPYHVQRVQDLLPADHEKRVQFCREMLRRNQENPQFFNNILWSDETCFKKVGIFNIHNLHYWARINPKVVRRSHFQHLFGVNMWAGIVDGKLIGPFELPRRINGEAYLSFLQNDLNGLLDDVSLQIRGNMWLQHDGAPPHYARVVRQHLNANYASRWIGRGGTIPWPPRSPDLNPLDFFLWGYFKELVYERENQTEQEMRQRIIEATNTIKNNERAFRRIKINFIRRCRLCIIANGGNFEHLL